ncbi:MAG: (2Fe-2S)-binding protein [Burkholderiaceae bacterium]
MADVEDQSDEQRRELLHSIACLSGAALAFQHTPAFANPGARTEKPYRAALLVNEFGEPIRASRLAEAEPWVFNYPFQGTPAFLIRLPQPVTRTSLRTAKGSPYDAAEGTGESGNIVAYSAICAHKMMYPTPAISFIGLRPGFKGEPSQVIHCCGDDSRYDPAKGAQVLAGPAEQPLASILLKWDPKTDQLTAVGTAGGEMFDAFFEKYAFKLALDNGPKATQACERTTLAKPLKAYSRQVQTCKA